MSSRIQEWLQAENTVVKTYEQLENEQPEEQYVSEYNEKVLKPWTEQNQMENEIRKTLGVPPTWASEREKIEWHRRQLALLEKANQAPRCEHIFTDGRQCRSPRVRKGQYCYAHVQMLARRPLRMNLPPLEDANAVTLWLMEVSRGLLDGQISERTAGLLFYGLQLAMVNARWTTFTETNPAEMIRKLPGVSNRRGRTTGPTSKKKEITTEGTEDTEKRESINVEPASLRNGESLITEKPQPRAALPMQANTGLARGPAVPQELWKIVGDWITRERGNYHRGHRKKGEYQQGTGILAEQRKSIC